MGLTSFSYFLPGATDLCCLLFGLKIVAADISSRYFKDRLQQKVDLFLFVPFWLKVKV